MLVDASGWLPVDFSSVGRAAVEGARSVVLARVTTFDVRRTTWVGLGRLTLKLAMVFFPGQTLADRTRIPCAMGLSLPVSGTRDTIVDF